MKEARITKLVTYKTNYTQPAFYLEAVYPNGSETEAYCGITEAQTKSCETENVYTGDEAIRKFWDIKFGTLTDTERSLILSVFPDIESKDKTTLKTPQELHGIAFRKALRHFAVPCPRCGGSGSYAQSVAYTEVDSGVCHKCFGRGKVLPRLTAKKTRRNQKLFQVGGETMILNIVLISAIVVLTAGMIAAFAIDYKRAKTGRKSVFWGKKNRR